MTREEVIELFKDVEVLVFRDVKQKYFHEDIEEAFKLAIRSLEKESILDKIRAEINTMSGDIETIADMLAIIDKYKAESEVSE